jgi:hypothetical protein
MAEEHQVGLPRQTEEAAVRAVPGQGLALCQSDISGFRLPLKATALGE